MILIPILRWEFGGWKPTAPVRWENFYFSSALPLIYYG